MTAPVSAIINDLVMARVEAGRSLTAIAREWGLSRRQLARYRSGETRPSAAVMGLIAEMMRPKIEDFGFFAIDHRDRIGGETVFTKALRQGGVVYGHADCPNLLITFNANDHLAYVGVRSAGIAQIAGSRAFEIAFGSLLQTVSFRRVAVVADFATLLSDRRQRAILMRTMRRVERFYLRYLTDARQDRVNQFSAEADAYAEEAEDLDTWKKDLAAAGVISKSGLARISRARRQINGKMRVLA